MKKCNIPEKIAVVPTNNLVAKFAHQFNKAHVFEDKNKYHRHTKHRKQDTSQIILAKAI